jgi:hypothetical protein
MNEISETFLRPSDMRAIRSFRSVAMINANEATPSTASA